MFVFYQLYEIKPKQVYSNVPVLLSDDFLYYYRKRVFLAKLYVRRIFQVVKYAYLGKHITGRFIYMKNESIYIFVSQFLSTNKQNFG